MPKPENVENLGCFKTDANNTLVPILLGSKPFITVNDCYREVVNSGKKYPVFAIKQDRCYVSEKADSYNKIGKSQECFCNRGGLNEITVYKIKDLNVEPEFTSLGCWKDSRNRAMSLITSEYNSMSEMTPTICYDIVKKTGKNFAVFGVQVCKFYYEEVVEFITK